MRTHSGEKTTPLKHPPETIGNQIERVVAMGCAAAREIVAHRGSEHTTAKARGLSQEELADRARFNRNYIGMLEREENAPTVDVLERLAEALAVEPVALIGRK